MAIPKQLTALLFSCHLLASTGSVVAQDIEPDILEFVAGTQCVSMPTGVSKLFFNATSLKSVPALSIPEMLDSAVIDESIVTDMTDPAASDGCLQPGFHRFPVSIRN